MIDELSAVHLVQQLKDQDVLIFSLRNKVAVISNDLQNSRDAHKNASDVAKQAMLDLAAANRRIAELVNNDEL